MPDLPDNIDRIIRSKRRTIALIVERDGSITVRAPMRISGDVIRQFVAKHAKWVQKKQQEMQTKVPEPSRQYLPGESFLYLDQAYPMEIVKITNQRLVLDGSFKLAQSAQGDAEAIFRSWYQEQARMVIGERLELFVRKLGVQIGKVRITSARTRWGSCSSQGTLSFSWRLVMVSPALIDYVIVHELAHTVHHNHSKRFWKLVEEWMPDYRERRKQLRQYGQDVL